MTREGYLKWKDTEVFNHWVNGGEIEFRFIGKLNWRCSYSPNWQLDCEYQIRKPKNKWEGTDVYEHWMNGGEVEYRFKDKWVKVNKPTWHDRGEYRCAEGYWILTEPPKDRWILRESKDKDILHLKFCFGFWSTVYNKVYFEDSLIPKKWAKIPN